MQSTHYLNPELFQTSNNECQARKEAILKQLETFRSYQAWGNEADSAIKHFALSISCYNHKAFLIEVSALKEILESVSKEEGQRSQIKEVQSYFIKRPFEDWCLLLYEVYVWHCNQDRKVIANFISLDLFDMNIHVFSKSCAKFCDLTRNLLGSYAQDELQQLFGLLKMTQVSLRHTKETFMANIMPSLGKQLTKIALRYFEYCLHSLEEWKGNWYIFDINLFSHDLLIQYEKEMNLALHILQKEEQKKHANFIFVIALYYLGNGDLTNWSLIDGIPFAENSQELQKFQNLAKKF